VKESEREESNVGKKEDCSVLSDRRVRFSSLVPSLPSLIRRQNKERKKERKTQLIESGKERERGKGEKNAHSSMG
jgi:hypothetical protein